MATQRILNIRRFIGCLLLLPVFSIALADPTILRPHYQSTCVEASRLDVLGNSPFSNSSQYSLATDELLQAYGLFETQASREAFALAYLDTFQSKRPHKAGSETILGEWIKHGEFEVLPNLDQLRVTSKLAMREQIIFFESLLKNEDQLKDFCRNWFQLTIEKMPESLRPAFRLVFHNLNLIASDSEILKSYRARISSTLFLLKNWKGSLLAQGYEPLMGYKNGVAPTWWQNHRPTFYPVWPVIGTTDFLLWIAWNAASMPFVIIVPFFSPYLSTLADAFPILEPTALLFAINSTFRSASALVFPEKLTGISYRPLALLHMFKIERTAKNGAIWASLRGVDKLSEGWKRIKAFLIKKNSRDFVPPEVAPAIPLHVHLENDQGLVAADAPLYFKSSSLMDESILKNENNLEDLFPTLESVMQEFEIFSRYGIVKPNFVHLSHLGIREIVEASRIHSLKASEANLHLEWLMKVESDLISLSARAKELLPQYQLAYQTTTDESQLERLMQGIDYLSYILGVLEMSRFKVLLRPSSNGSQLMKVLK